MVTFVQGLVATAGKRLVTTPNTSPLIEAARLLTEKNTHLVIVCDATECVTGVVTKSDVVRQISACQGSSCHIMVSEVMTKDVVVCRPDQKLHDVWLLMKEKSLKQIPVVTEAHKPLGLLYASEVVEALLKEVEFEELLLRDYVMGVGYR